MGLNFVAASSQTLDKDVTAGTFFGTNEIFAISLWFKRASSPAAFQVAFGHTVAASNNQQIAVWIGDDVVALNMQNSGSVGSAATTSPAGYVGTAWHHLAASGAGDGKCYCWIDGGYKGQATRYGPGNFEHISIGSYKLSNANQAFFNGIIAELAIWKGVSLTFTDADAASLAKGFSPLLVKPIYLFCYWPFIGGALTERRGGTELTPSASAPTAAVHVPIIYPGMLSVDYITLPPPTTIAPTTLAPTTPPPPSFIPSWASQANTLIQPGIHP